MDANNSRWARVRRLKAGAVALCIAVPVVLLCTFPTDASSHPVRHALACVGMFASGPLSALVLWLPFGAWPPFSALWPLYFLAIAFTRVGLVHWGRHLAVLILWHLVSFTFLISMAASF